MLEFVVTDLHHERPAATDYYGVLLGLNCRFSIRLDHQALFEEAEFPVLEFVEQLADWLAESPEPAANFSYESIESDVEDLVWIRRTNRGWRLGSAIHDSVAHNPFTLDELRGALSQLNTHLAALARRDLDLDVSDYITGEARRRHEAGLH
jgi:hypothetical protein